MGKYKKHPKSYQVQVIGDITGPPKLPPPDAPLKVQNEWMRACRLLYPRVGFRCFSHTPGPDGKVSVRELETP